MGPTEPRIQAPALVLAVDDDENELKLLRGLIAQLGYGVVTATNGEEALAKLEARPVSAIITDLFMPRIDGAELLRTLLDRGILTPAIVYTGFGDMEQAVSFVHELNAFWFLEKPARTDVLATLLSRAIQYGTLLRETERLQRELGYTSLLGEMVGVSEAMQHVFSLVRRVAPTTAPVLITGESGTGKEIAARTIHKLSRRAANPFVAINCAALPQDLIESELFGYERGAFTGAANRHPGCFEQAHEGTLFLDEIGEMPLAMQARLLRVIEESKVRRLGGTAEIPIDVRILAATNRPLDQALEQKALREDLYFRLTVMRLHLPPLRDRREDLPVLAAAILEKLCGKHDREPCSLSAPALDRLASHSWPGNARELRNVLEWTLITTDLKGAGNLISLHHLPQNLGTALPTPNPAPRTVSRESQCHFEVGRTLEEIEDEYIRATLAMTNNDRKRAARLLGISLRTLYNRLAEAHQSAKPHVG
jgi:DNA-binding NtrC family response regulator